MRDNQRDETRSGAKGGHRGRRLARGIVAFAIGLVALPCPSAVAQPTMLDPVVTQIGSGSSLFTCALTTAGGVKCWGYNGANVLGDGTQVPQLTPVDVLGLNGVVSLGQGSNFTCALMTSGVVKCWGRVPHLDFSDAATPTEVPGLSGVVSLSGGGAHMCALSTAGGVKCWGRNFEGQVGDGTTTRVRTNPTNVTGLASGVAEVSGAGFRTCALMKGGGAKCWGTDAAPWENIPPVLLPVDVPGLTSGLTRLSAAGSHTCALTVAGGANCWGRNISGEVGDGTKIQRLAPVDVSGLASGVSKIRAGGGRTCAATTTGTGTCWGSDPSSTFPNPLPDRSTPAPVEGLASDVADFAFGSYHNCALTSAGGVQCWGNPTGGSLGNGGGSSVTPVNVAGLANGLIHLSAGEGHTCALTSGGGTRCWGLNSDGQLGDSSEVDRMVPTNVPGLNILVTKVAAGGFHTCALRTDGGLKCWGQNLFGQLGDGSTAKRSWANDVPGLTSSVASVSAGSIHTCALTSAGGVKCWGANSSGQIGDGTTIDRTAPTDVQGLTSGVLGISTGRYHTCAQMIAGGLKCWGSNIFGQVGDGTTTDRVSPTDVTGLSSAVVSINAGANHTCAHLASGSVKCWGYNAGGALGDGTTQDRWTPVEVADLSSGVLSLSGGLFHTCAVTSTGGAKCWGYSQSGQLGNGVYGLFPTPVDVLGLTSGVASIHAGLLHTCALTTDGGLRCWGSNGNGRLGDGTTNPSPAPVALSLGQKIAFVPPAAIAIGASTTLSATASSGLPVTFDTWTPGTCSVSGNTVTATAFALCGIRASQAGDIHNAAAPQQLRVIAVFSPPAVTTGSATSITESTALLNGTGTPNGLDSTSYFEYGLTTAYGTLTPPQSLGSGAFAVPIASAISDLACNSLYHSRAVVTNSGYSVQGSDNTFTTSVCPPPPTVTTEAAASFAQTGATLKGVINPMGGATRRRFEYGLTAAYGLTSPDLAIGAGSSDVAVSHAVSSLSCNTLYHYRAVGQSNGGLVNGGDLTFTTAACPVAGSNNISPFTARSLTPDSASRDSMSDVRAEIWYRARLFAGRSYQISVWPVDHEQGTDAPALSVSVFSDNAGSVAATPAPTSSSGEAEGSPNSPGDPLPVSAFFSPTTTGAYKIRILRTTGGGVSHTINVAVRETTLFSPWTSLAAGFEGFVEMHNNTGAPVSVTLRAYDGAGLLQGAGLTFTIPANATVFRTAAEVGVPAEVFAGIVLTHNGAVGAVSANITTLNGANGLSFDSPFTLRDAGVLGLPVR